MIKRKDRRNSTSLSGGFPPGESSTRSGARTLRDRGSFSSFSAGVCGSRPDARHWRLAASQSIGPPSISLDRRYAIAVALGICRRCLTRCRLLDLWRSRTAATRDHDPSPLSAIRTEPKESGVVAAHPWPSPIIDFSFKGPRLQRLAPIDGIGWASSQGRSEADKLL
jgi:hypothetical protein